MKPIPQISSNQLHSRGDSRARCDHRSFSLTDYSYQSTGEAEDSSLPIPEKAQGFSKLRMFRKLSSDFFGMETSRNYAAELTLFALIAGLSVWPILSMIVALYRMIK